MAGPDGHGAADGAAVAPRAIVHDRRLRAGARRARRGPPRLLPHGRRRLAQPGHHQLLHRVCAPARVQGDPAAVFHEQGRDGRRGAAGAIRRGAVPRPGLGRRRRRRQVPHRHVRAAHMRLPQGRVACRGGAAPEVLRHLDVLPQGGGVARPRHVGHLPRAPVRKGRAVRHRGLRRGRVAQDARGDARVRRGLCQVAGLPVPRGQHRLRRAQQRRREEVRLGGMVPLPADAPRARLLLQLHGLPVARHGDSVRPEEGGAEREEVRPHAQLDARRLWPHHLLPPRKLPDGRRRQRPRGAAALYGRHGVHALRPRDGRQPLRLRRARRARLPRGGRRRQRHRRGERRAPQPQGG
mmetsp:Transcript_10449/g.34606  ORF Transcript_10449/g.34606 Transcript_10449/m.34606 type:complete len:352 (-) Transcript_10449:206-1261(-)